VADHCKEFFFLGGGFGIFVILCCFDVLMMMKVLINYLKF
jgi:hypothetical protein